MRLPFLLLALFWLPHAQAADIPLATVVRFNTLCATCHEGECSGRLSFDLGIEAAENHIRRHAGDVDRNVWRDLARLLAHTKQACAYYPMAVDIPKDRHWGPERLAGLHNAKENAWFIPLGHLPAGRYRARLGVHGQTEGVAQIISASFDVADFPLRCADDGQNAFLFVVDRGSVHYLRFRTDKARTLTHLDIQPAD